MESADRVLRVLEVFGPTERELTLSEIADRMQLPKSSVHRLLATLSARRYVERDSQTHRYSLGIRLFEIGSNVIHGRGLHTAAHPVLEKLTMATGETCHLAVLHGIEAVYVYKLDGLSSIAMPSRVGGRAPGHATSIGKVLLAWADPEVRRQALGGKLKRYARNTTTDPKLLEAELDRVREQGYAVDLEEFEDGLSCVAAPVRDMSGRVVAAVGVAAPSFRLTADVLPSAVEAVIEAGEAISKQLGYVHRTRPAVAVARGI